MYEMVESVGVMITTCMINYTFRVKQIVTCMYDNSTNKVNQIDRTRTALERVKNQTTICKNCDYCVHFTILLEWHITKIRGIWDRQNVILWILN